MGEPAATVFRKAPHARGCDGALTRRAETVHVDRIGRVGNGGLVAHDYRCNHSWDGCRARVLVLERAVRLLAVAVEVRR